MIYNIINQIDYGKKRTLNFFMLGVLFLSLT